MKFLCAACERLVAASAFRTERAALLLTCSRCGAENPLEVQPGSAPAGKASTEAAGSNTPVELASSSAPAAATASASSVSSSRPPLTVRTEASSAPPSFASVPATPTGPARVVALRSVSDAVKLAAEAADRDDPFEVPEDRCPKCVGARSPGHETCPHCGLAFVNFNAAESQPSPALADAFRAAMRAWDDPLRHELALALAMQRGELPQLGRLYRLRLIAAPLDPVAQRGRDEVVRRASAAGEAMRQLDKTAGRRTPRWQIAVLVLLSVGLIALMGMLVRQLAAS